MNSSTTQSPPFLLPPPLPRHPFSYPLRRKRREKRTDGRLGRNQWSKTSTTKMGRGEEEGKQTGNIEFGAETHMPRKEGARCLFFLLPCTKFDPEEKGGRCQARMEGRKTGTRKTEAIARRGGGIPCICVERDMCRTTVVYKRWNGPGMMDFCNYDEAYPCPVRHRRVIPKCRHPRCRDRKAPPPPPFSPREREGN